VTPDPIKAAEEAASVRKLGPADEPPAVAALARSFYDDPVMSWIFRDDSRRLEQLERGFALFGRTLWFNHDEAYTTDARAGAALWLPPGTWKVGFLRQLTLLPAMVRIGRGDIGRLMRTLNLIENEHPHDRHYYLPILGVSPEWQGKGLGTALLRPVLGRCDREDVPAYLEASSPRNRALYERHGFEVTGELRSGDSPPFWAMWRKPSPS
jgi:GNAT superfamily N-acetyltransferase